MPVIDFPNSPTVGDQYTESGKTWEYDGTAWNLVVGPLELATNSVTSGKIFNGSVLETKLANSAVSTNKIANAAVTEAKLANNAVTEGRIATGAVTSSKLAANSVGSSSIAANAVALGAQTTGNYVASLVAGTGVTLANNSGESATPTVSIGQSVGTLDSPTFEGLTANSSLTVNGLLTPVSVKEAITISATAATGTINLNARTTPTVLYTSNSSADWTINVRGSASLSLNSMLATGEMATVTFLATNGTTAYRPTAFQVDGASVTPKWQGGNAPSTGNANSIDAYTFTVIKTANAAFTMLASQTKFA